MANTIGTQTYREKWYKANLQQVLKNALVAEKVFEVDSSDAKVIKNPYSSRPTVTVQALAGTYSAADFTTTNDDLTITDEFIVAEHIMDFQSVLSNYDLFANRMDEHAYSVAASIDSYVLNVVLEAGTGTYTTPAGGFTTAANINTIVSNLASKVMGYAESYKGMFLVIENTDVVGFMSAQMTNGFSYADAALKNGFMTSYAGVEIYVVRTGTFADATVGTQTFTNAGHRLFGVKGAATYCAPRGIQYEEKSVAGKTGKEIVSYGYIGAKLWKQKEGLIVDITLA